MAGSAFNFPMKRRFLTSLYLFRNMHGSFVRSFEPYQIIVADAADAVSVNFSGRCKFLQI